MMTRDDAEYTPTTCEYLWAWCSHCGGCADDHDADDHDADDHDADDHDADDDVDIPF